MNLDDILEQIPVDQIAGRLGVDTDTARNAIGVALPALVGGMQANAQDPAGAASLASALGQHDNDLLDNLLGGNLDVGQVDTADGSNIVGHVFGDQQDQVVSQLAGASGAGGGLIAKLLPMLAPIVMSYLAKRVLGGGNSAGSGGGLGDVLGNVLGGGAGGSAGGGLGDILGQVLGGRSGGGAGGVDLGDLLGGLLGGGRR
ncbi:MAG: DUF937 domain-containing protein [Kineosporiaceae bacterium]|nr:DUF937 domain-containing protein [Kineosporiaceae bacterium]MBK7625205.1 DUF937 domain-containing protein [Kineosporiaceae bacterium]MBK8076415.1 DUF937 domain-containing protein [Kineosporiaceae bacterium]